MNKIQYDKSDINQADKIKQYGIEQAFLQ